MKKSIFVAVISFEFLLTACYSVKKMPHKAHSVYASFVTPPSKDGKDHVDDPAIYVNIHEPSKSFVIATNKSRVGGGLHLYDLQGKELDYLADGRMNNVDIRYGFFLGGKKIDIAVATHRSQKRLAIYQIDPNSQRLINIAADPLIFDFSPYGGCLYHNFQTGKFYFFATQSGKIQQLELYDNGYGQVSAKIVRTLEVGSQCEGCVADDRAGSIFVGEEDVAIWKYKADPWGGDYREEIDSVGKNLVADIEGLTLYQKDGGKGYLIASSQGNNTYVVYDRQIPHSYKGTFYIAPKGAIEGTEQTDGISVVSQSLLPHFPKGLFVAHDNRTSKGGGSNFKFVSWAQVEKGLKGTKLKGK